MEGANKRGYYRVVYPKGERPKLLIGVRTLEVVDCSESGLLFALEPEMPRPRLGLELRGIVRFGDRAAVLVIGVVARVFEDCAALRFTGSGVPYSTILEEQKHLRRTYLGNPKEPGRSAG